jgi:hypothetical protein
MKRQRGRGRKPGGGGGGGGSHNHGNRSLESNGPDVKIRGTAAQIYEKYSQYARDAQSAGDRVKYENLLQHAEHYFRIMVATMPRDRLFQQQGEGGMPMQPQGLQQGGEGQQQPVEGSVPGEAADPLKVMDDQQGDDDGDYDDGDDDREGGGDEQVEGSGDEQRQQDGQQQGDRQGRRRRRGRRRHHEGDRNNQQQNAGNQNNGNSGDNNEPREPRSALDSLARRQGAIAGS